MKPICPYCRVEWNNKNVKIEDWDASEGCESCGYGRELKGTIIIKCHNCKKIIYRKDFEAR